MRELAEPGSTYRDNLAALIEENRTSTGLSMPKSPPKEITEGINRNHEWQRVGSRIGQVEAKRHFPASGILQRMPDIDTTGLVMPAR